MPKILLVTNIFPPQIGGPATFIERLAEHLTVSGQHDITVVCSSERQSDAGDRDRPYRVRRVPSTVSPLRFHYYVRKTLLREMVAHRQVLVNGLESYAYQIARLTGRRYVLKVVGDPVWESARNVGRTNLDIDQFQVDPGEQARFHGQVAARNRYVQLASHVITPSDYLNRMVQQWGVPPERVTTIANGVDLATSPDSLPGIRRAGERLRLLFVGRLTNWKGVETLLLAVKDMDGLEIRILGDGPAMPQLVELAAQLGVNDRVTFAGRQSKEEVGREMMQAHALILASLYEGLSHTLLEALAMGLPCIASDRGGNGEVITPEVGMLVPAQDPSALATAIATLRDDEPHRQRLSRNARIAARHFSMDATVKAVAALLELQAK